MNYLIEQTGDTAVSDFVSQSFTHLKIIRADHMGMCFGVHDAIALAQKTREPLTILGDLVHNETVLADLRECGIEIRQRVEEVTTPNVMITAHGISERALAAIKRTGLNVLEATCPLVRFAHESIVKLAADGFHPVIIGKRDHVEVRGLTGDLDEFDVIGNDEDVLKLAERLRYGIAAQTTQPMEKVERLVALIRARFPQSEVRFVDTVCRPTKQRQAAAIALAKQCDVVIVIGGAHSNNTHELAATCRRHCARVHHVQDAEGLRSEWFVGAQQVGITAGTSTPSHLVDVVEQRICELTK